MNDVLSPPTPERVARRAFVLAGLHLRSVFEDEGDRQAAEQARASLSQELQELGVWEEAEEPEQAYLSTSLGSATERLNIDAWWRVEGLGVLAWALGLLDELPPYDEGFLFGPIAAAGIELMEPEAGRQRIASATLRSPAELHAAVRLLTLVRWRLTELRAGGGGRMDFRAYLQQHPCFRPAWLDGLEFDAEGELMISPGFGEEGKLPREPVDQLDPEAVASCDSLNRERQLAANWLEGDAERYSEVSASTILAALDPPNAETCARSETREARRLVEARARATERAVAARGVEELSDAEVLERLEALEPRLKRFEKIVLPDLRRACASGGLSEGQRAKAAKLLAAYP